MLYDTVLANIKSSSDKTIWGRYDHIYNWSWDEKEHRPTIYPLSQDGVIMTGAVMMRDWLIAKQLSKMGIKKVLDVGSDTGHLIATLTANNLEAIGIDANNNACDYINKKNVNTCYNVSIQDLITIDKLGNNYDCLICLNIIQVPWEDEALKKAFLLWIRKHFKYAVLSNLSNTDEPWEGFERVHTFTIGRFYYNKLVGFIYRILGINPLMYYSDMQKIYKIK